MHGYVDQRRAYVTVLRTSVFRLCGEHLQDAIEITIDHIDRQENEVQQYNRIKQKIDCNVQPPGPPAVDYHEHKTDDSADINLTIVHKLEHKLWMCRDMRIGPAYADSINK